MVLEFVDDGTIVLAHELAHVVLQQTVSLESNKWAFEDRLMVPDEELLKYLNFKPNQHDEAAADTKAANCSRIRPTEIS